MSLQLPPIFATLQPLLIIFTNILTLAIGPHHRLLQFAFSVPVLFFLAAQSLYRVWELGWGLHYGLNCFIVTTLATWVDWILLNNPYKEEWVKLDQRKSSSEEQQSGRGAGNGHLKTNGDAKSNGIVPSQANSAPVNFSHRLWWAIRLATTNRYTGWTSEVKNVPASVPASYPRWKFLARKLPRFALFLLLKDAIYSYTASSPHGTWLDLYPASRVAGFEGRELGHKLYWTWVQIALTYIALELMTTLYSLIAVSLFLASPHDCPRMFNDIRGAYTVRRAWSFVWHQQMRRLCTAPSLFLVRKLNLPRGSFASKYTQLFAGFFISGAIHAIAAMLTHGSLNDDNAMRAFMLQACAIFVEDHVVQLAKRCGARDSLGWRALGWVWVVVCVGGSMQVWTGRTMARGTWVHEREADFFGLGPE